MLTKTFDFIKVSGLIRLELIMYEINEEICKCAGDVHKILARLGFETARDVWRNYDSNR